MKKDFEKVKKYVKLAASVAVFAMTYLSRKQLHQKNNKSFGQAFTKAFRGPRGQSPLALNKFRISTTNKGL